MVFLKVLHGMLVKNRTTLADVARAAGVGTTAASVILNAPSKAERFSADTIARVRRVARETGYHLNQRARSLRKGNSEIVGMAIGGGISHAPLGGHYFASLAGGIQRSLWQRGYNLLLISAQDGESPPEVGLGFLKSERIDALIIPGSAPAALRRRMLAENSRIVFVNDLGTNSDFAVINSDDVRGAVLATEHLLQLGHRSLLWVGPDNWFDKSTVRRAKAFKKTCQKAGAKFSLLEFPIPGDFRDRARQEVLSSASATALSGLLEGGAAFTGIVCYNPYCAAGAYHALRQAGLSIPEEVSVLSFEGQISGYFTPTLTSVNLKWEDVGMAAAQTLLQALDSGKMDVRSTLIRPELSAGDSTAPAKQ